MYHYKLKLIETYQRPSTDIKWYNYSTEQMNNPWKILGFTDKPIWWQNYYSDVIDKNNKCWQDIMDGIIREGDKKGQYSELETPWIHRMVEEQTITESLQEQGKMISFTEEGWDTTKFVANSVYDSITSYEEHISLLEHADSQDYLNTMDEYNKTHGITVELEEFLLDND
jgi:hypothetical protein